MFFPSNVFTHEFRRPVISHDLDRASIWENEVAKYMVGKSRMFNAIKVPTIFHPERFYVLMALSQSPYVVSSDVNTDACR